MKKVKIEKDTTNIFLSFFHLDLLRSFRANFEFNKDKSNNNGAEQPINVEPLGKINVCWEVSDSANISQFILQWHSSKDLIIKQEKLNVNQTSLTIG